VQTREPTTVLAGRYALEQELGRSGTGLVWRAEDRLLRRTVAVKLVDPHLGDDPAFTERLAEEARRVASLATPGIARLLDSGDEDGIPFLVREHVEGESARSRLDRSGPLPAVEAARIAIGVLEALAPAHEAGVLHLHLGANDVLLTPDGGVRVTDLGIGPAVTATRRPHEAARLLGEHDLAPEQRETGAVDRRTDVFAAGAVLFELLTGERSAGRRSARRVRPGVPRALDRVVSRALDPDPDRRFADVGAFAAAVRAAAPPRPGEPADVRRPRILTWLGVPVAVVLVAAAVIAVGLWLGRLEVGGPLGIRPAEERAGRSATAAAPAEPLRPVEVFVHDPPPGDGSENDSNAPLAIDGDPATAWRSENYFDGVLNKEGVGLVFDLGRTRRLVEFRLSTPSPGFQFHVAVGDDPASLVEAIGDPYTAAAETRGALSGSGRYVLVWITTVVEVADGNRAEVGELSVTVEPDA
jgi:serine/threonine-protein kinase